MAKFDTLIKNGTVASESGVVRQDVAIKDGRIAALGENLGEAAETIDATGLLVLPGGKANLAFARLVAEESQAQRPLGLDDLLLLNHLWIDRRLTTEEAARLLGVTGRFKPLTMEQVTLRAARPRFCALDNGKLAAAGFPMPPWQDALGRWLSARGTMKV